MSQNITLAELKIGDFIVIPSQKFAITKVKIQDITGRILTSYKWYDIKMFVQKLGPSYFLPTSAQWNKAREYLQLHYPEVEKDMITNEYEWVDSLLAIPNKKQEYSSKIKIPKLKKGKNPILIEHPIIKKIGENYIIKQGKVTEVPKKNSIPIRVIYYKLCRIF